MPRRQGLRTCSANIYWYNNRLYEKLWIELQKEKEPMKEVNDLLRRLFINPKSVDFTTAFSVRSLLCKVFGHNLTLSCLASGSRWGRVHQLSRILHVNEEITRTKWTIPAFSTLCQQQSNTVCKRLPKIFTRRTEGKSNHHLLYLEIILKQCNNIFFLV